MELQKSVNSNEAMVIASLAKKLPKPIFTCLSLCLLCCFSVSVFGQDLIRNTQAGNSSTATNDSSYVAQTLAPDWEATSFESIAPTSINTISDAKIDEFSNYGVLLDLDKSYIDNLLTNQPEKLILGIPVNNSYAIELQLSKIDITTNDFKITTSSGASIPNNQSSDLFYWGIVKDNPGSIAAVSFYEDEVRCIISDEDGNYVLGAYEDAHVLYATNDLKEQHDFSCDVRNEFLVEELMGNINSITEIDLEEFENVKPIEINVECDYQMYLTFDSDAEKVRKHVTDLFNESAVLFANEKIKIKLGEIFVWDYEDPFIHLDSLHKVLDAFSEYRAGEYPGKVGVFLSDKVRPGNGWAWVGGLCSEENNFAAIKITDPTKVVPVSTYSYDVFTFTHELGHLFGANHTQDCVWGPDHNQALDNCVEPYGNCAPGPEPIDGGTIMSYCTTNANIGVNFEKGFGVEPGDRIRAYINSANCVDPEPCSIPYNEQVFIDYPWLYDIIDQENCAYTEIRVFDYRNWVYLKTLSGNFIYIDGEKYCSDHATLDCLDFYSEYLTNEIYNSCGCACEEPEICNVDPCLEGGIQTLNEDCECEIVEVTKTGCDDPTASNYDPAVNCPDNDTCVPQPPPPPGGDTCSENETIFSNYSWLSNIVDRSNCNGISLKEYYSPYYAANFVEVISGNSAVLYYYTGFEMCTNCISSYNLTEDDLINDCSCTDDIEVLGCIDANACNYNVNANSNDGTCTYNNSYKGIVFYEKCDGGQNYYLIYLPDGTVLDPFNADGVDFDYPEGATVEFGYVEEKITTCEVADQAVVIECINEIDCEYSTKGIVIFEECDNGIVYYLIQLDNGRIIDPYNFDGLTFNYIEGAKVEVSYMPSSEIACNLADAAVDIICIQEIPEESGCDPNRAIFDAHPFLYDIVDFDNCAGVKIRESGQFIIVEDAGGQSLYLNTGTYYCNWESCIDHYLTDGAPCVWNCEAVANKSGSLTNVSLKKYPIEIIEIIPNPNKGKFSLKINTVIEHGNQPKVELFSIEGKLLNTFNNAEQFTTLDISEFGKGVYLLSVKTSSKRAVEKLIVN